MVRRQGISLKVRGTRKGTWALLHIWMVATGSLAKGKGGEREKTSLAVCGKTTGTGEFAGSGANQAAAIHSHSNRPVQTETVAWHGIGRGTYEDGEG